MNYSNMIEEKNLKKTFIIATLVSTLIGTFTTGLGLYERIDQKRKQKKTDADQDKQIKELSAKLKSDEEKEKKRKSEPDDEHIQKSLGGSGQLIKREYDQNFERFGDRFARGDQITQNQLQGQVITLQGTVIHLLEDALYTGRIADPRALYNASELAREGSISALQQQYQRMMQQAPLRRPIHPVRRISSQPSLLSSKSRALPPASSRGGPLASTKGGNDESRSLVARSKTLAVDTDGPLFCIYSQDLQRDNKMPLHDAFARGANNQCPACKTTLAIEQGRAWKIVKDVVHERISTPEYDDEIIEERTYLIGNRFIIKSHRENGGFACPLCARGRDKDTLLESAQGLVRHIWQKHEAEEYNDVDIKQVGALEVEDIRIWDGESPMGVLAALKRAHDRMTGNDKRPRRKSSMQSSRKKRRQAPGYLDGKGHKVKKKVQFDLEA